MTRLCQCRGWLSVDTVEGNMTLVDQNPLHRTSGKSCGGAEAYALLSGPTNRCSWRCVVVCSYWDMSSNKVVSDDYCGR